MWHITHICLKPTKQNTIICCAVHANAKPAEQKPPNRYEYFSAVFISIYTKRRLAETKMEVFKKAKAFINGMYRQAIRKAEISNPEVLIADAEGRIEKAKSWLPGS